MKLHQLLIKLIKFKTLSNDHRENEGCLCWIKMELQTLPLFFKIVHSGPYSSLLVTTRRTKTPIVWLVAHIDVVPGPPKVFMPFSKGSRLYGRGAFDMKFAAACYIKLLKDLRQELPLFNFGVMLTSDEEIGGENGVAYLLKNGYLSKIAVVPDGGANWEIEKGAKGAFELYVTAKGVSAHGSRTWLGKNAIVLLLEFIEQLHQLFPKEPCGNSSHWHATCNIGKIEGGRAVNQVPDFAKALLDIRFRSVKVKQNIEKKIKFLQKHIPGIHTDLTVVGESFRNNADMYAKRFSEIAKKRYNITTGPCFSHGTSDGRFFASKGIPVLATRPKGGGLHSEKEWIDLKDLERFYEVLKEFVTEISILK